MPTTATKAMTAQKIQLRRGRNFLSKKTRPAHKTKANSTRIRKPKLRPVMYGKNIERAIHIERNGMTKIRILMHQLYKTVNCCLFIYLRWACPPKPWRRGGFFAINSKSEM